MPPGGVVAVRAPGRHRKFSVPAGSPAYKLCAGSCGGKPADHSGILGPSPAVGHNLSYPYAAPPRGPGDVSQLKFSPLAPASWFAVCILGRGSGRASLCLLLRVPRLRRERRTTPDRFLFWKVAIFFLTAGIWLAGVIAGRSWLTGAALVLLLFGVLLRFLPQNGEAGEGGTEEESRTE